MLIFKLARGLAVAVLLALGLRQCALATTYYLSPNGLDASNNGKSIATAWRTLNYAESQVKPGDTVYALDGDYTDPYGYNALYATVAGKPAAWIKFKAYPGAHPTIHNAYWQAVEITASVSYFEFSGFEIIGNDLNVTLAQAQAQPQYGAPQFNDTGIYVDGTHGGGSIYPHHIRIINNKIHNCGGPGVQVTSADYVWVTGNTVYDNSWYSVYGTSGISVAASWNSDSYTGYKMFVTGNRVFGNQEFIPWVSAGAITDGEGIILDSNENSGSSTLSPYTGRFLVANNIVYGNGSAAIEAYLTQNADILNNSTYENVVTPVLQSQNRGELFLNNVSDINVLNNVFYSAAGQSPVSIPAYTNACEGCLINSNLYYNGPNYGASLSGPEDITANPLYEKPDAADPLKVNLRVKCGSPALRAGQAWLDHYVDYSNHPRGDDRAWDIGAYEHVPAS